MSQLVNTRFIRSFQSYQLSSVRWLLSGSLFTAVYSLVRIRATVGMFTGGLMSAGGLAASGLAAGGLAAGGLRINVGRWIGGQWVASRWVASRWVSLSTTRRHNKVKRG